MSQALQWFNMGGYAMYVWPAYGLVAAVMVLNLLGIKWQRRRAHKQLRSWFKRKVL